MFVLDQALPCVHMIISCPGARQRHCPRASSALSDHKELILNLLVLTQIVTENEF